MKTEYHIVPCTDAVDTVVLLKQMYCLTEVADQQANTHDCILIMLTNYSLQSITMSQFMEQLAQMAWSLSNIHYNYAASVRVSQCDQY